MKIPARVRRKEIRVLLVDDHPSVLEGIRAYLRRQEDINVVGQALDSDAAIEEARKLQPDIVVLDLSRSQMSKFEASRKIHDELPHSKIILFTMHDSESYVGEAKRAGAAAFVSKSSSLANLVDVIHKV